MNNLNPEDILVDHSSEDDLLEVPLTKKVFYAFGICAAFIVSIIAVKFLIISIGDSEVYTKSALANMTRTNLDRAPRGVVLDRFDEPLLENSQAYRVFLSPSNLPEDPEERSSVLRRVSEILSLDHESLSEEINNHDWNLGRPLIKKDITHDELVNLSSENIPGVDTEPGFKRIHDTSYVFSHILGYIGLANKDDVEENSYLTFENEIGKDGLELFYDKDIRGESGMTTSFVDAYGEIRDQQVSNPVPGSDLSTFIDKELQIFAYNRLKEQLDSIGSQAGAFLAINPQNGEVLSMVSIPSYDNNDIVSSFTQADQPLFNRVVSGTYNPGSTIKPLVALAALEEGIVTPDTEMYSPGYLSVENPYNPDEPSIFKDWKQHNWVDLRSALAKSSNVFFYVSGGGHVADDEFGLYRNYTGLGAQKLQDWWNKFRLDEKTMIDIPDEKTGFLPSPDWKEEALGDIWRQGDTYNISIGQGDLTITPAALLNYIAAIANGGKINKLRISQNSQPEVLSDFSEDISQDNLYEVQQGMIDAVTETYGTANMLNSLPMTSAGKTGSAEVGTRSVNAFFVGYAPAEDPEIAVLVLIEKSDEGSLNSVPVAYDVLNWYYQNRISN